MIQGKNLKLKQKTQGFGKIKNAACRKSVEKKAEFSDKLGEGTEL